MVEDEWLVQYCILERSLVASGGKRIEPETTVHVYPGRNFKSSALGAGGGRAWQGFCPRVYSWNLDKTNGPSQARHFVQINRILPKREKQPDPSLPHVGHFFSSQALHG